MNPRAAAVGLLCLGAAWASPARAQLRADADAELATTQFRTGANATGALSSGYAAGGRAALELGPVALAARYTQGRLSPDTGGAPALDLVEGSLFAAVRPATWLRLEVGPHLRAFVTPGATERWVLWEGRAFVEAPIVTDVLRASVGGWSALAASVNVGPGAGGASGGEAGLALRLEGSPLVFRLSYTVDHATLRSGGGAETLEMVKISLGLGRL